jgi:hypothetical protein
MPTRIMVWEIQNGAPAEVSEEGFSQLHRETELEDWIACNPGLLGEELLVIYRQHGQPDIPGVGRPDLLCTDGTGQLDVWIRSDKLGEVVNASQDVVEQVFREKFDSRTAPGGYDFVIRISTKEEAERLVDLFETLVRQVQQDEGRATGAA